MQIKKKHTHASDEHRTRPVAVKFYLTDDEAYRFDKLAADLGLTRRELVMASLDGVQIIDADSKAKIQSVAETLKDMQLQLKGVAININQMAKLANTSRMLPTEKKYKELAENAMNIGKEVSKQCQSLNQLLQKRTPKQL